MRISVVRTRIPPHLDVYYYDFEFGPTMYLCWYQIFKGYLRIPAFTITGLFSTGQQVENLTARKSWSRSHLQQSTVIIVQFGKRTPIRNKSLLWLVYDVIIRPQFWIQLL